MKVFRHWYFSALIILCTCIDEDLPDNGYPVVTTSISSISADGVTFSGTIEFTNLESVTDHGFVWGTDKENLSLDKSFFSSLGTVKGKEFSIRVGSALEVRVKYYGRSFAKTKTKTTYGPIVEFMSLGSEGPVVRSFSPAEGGYGDTVRLRGKNFSFKKETNIVTFEGVSANVVDAADTLLKVIVPGNLTKVNNKVKVTILNNGNEAPGTFNIQAPSIVSVVKSVFSTCDTLVIEGNNLSSFGDKPVVSFNYQPGKVISVSSKQIKVMLPWLVNNPITVRITSNLFDQTAPFTVTQIRPQITSIEPQAYIPGDTISASIANWAACQTMSAALFTPYQNYPVQVVESTPTSLKFIAPDVCIASMKLRLSGQTISISSEIELKQKPPIVHSIEPNHGKVYDEVVIRGQNLPQNMWWSIPTNFLDVTSYSDTELRGTVTEVSLMEGPSIDVYVTGCGGTTTVPGGFTYDAPEIHSIIPGLVNHWDEVITIYGKNLSPTQNTIQVGDNPRKIYAAASPEGDYITMLASDFLTDEQVTENISGQIKLTTMAEQSVTSDFQLTISYQSIWNSEPKFPGTARSRASTFTIDGKAYVGMGSNLPTNSFYTDWWEFDGANWTKKASFPDSPSQGTTEAAAAGGKGYFGLLNNQKKWWQYDPASDVWIRKADFTGPARSSHFVLSLNDKIYVGGGWGISGALKDFWEYDPATDQWTEKAQIPEFPLGRSFSFSYNGKGYAFSSNSGVLNTLVYDPVLNQWTMHAVSGQLPGTLADWVIMKFDDEVILQGAGFRTPPVLYQFIPETNSFRNIYSNYGVRSLATGFVLNGRGYIGLGIKGSAVSDFWSFDPAMLRY